MEKKGWKRIMAHDDAAGRTSTDGKDGKYLVNLAYSSNVMEPSTSSQLCIEFDISQAKCSQTKLYCQDFIQSFEELMKQCRHDTFFRLYCKVVYELVTRVHGLCKCENCLVQLKGVINELCSSCAQYIISDDFTSVPEAFRLNLSDALQAAQEELGDWTGDRFFRLAGLCVAPWSHPFLVGIMEGSSGPLGLERTQNYISYEGFDLLSSRVQILLEKDPSKAIKLCQACAEHCDIGKDTVFLETALVVLYNQGMPPDFSMQVWIQDSARVLKALKNMLTYYPAPVVKLVDTLLLKEWNQEYASLNKELLDLWIEAHYQHGSLDEVYGAAIDLAMYNDDTKSIVLFADTIMKQIGNEALPLFVNLLVDNVQVPFHRLDKKECQTANENNAIICKRLADALRDSSELHCLCRMAIFVSCPSKPNYITLEEAYTEARLMYKHPDVPLLSSRLDLVLTKVILGLLPKAFNPWKDWDSLEKLCHRLQKTTKTIETICKDDTVSGEVAYKKPSWFLTMLEDDWACYAKNARNEDGEVVYDGDDDAAELSNAISEVKAVKSDDIDKDSNSVKCIKNNDLERTKTDKNICINSETKIKKKRGRKSLKDRIAGSNIKELNKKCKNAKPVGDDPAKPRKKRGRKKKKVPTATLR